MKTKNKIKKSSKRLFVKLNIALLVIIVASYLVHLATANHAVNQRYMISQHAKHISVLKLESQKIANQVAELQSLQRLDTESQRLNLVKANTIEYIVGKSAVVLGN